MGDRGGKKDNEKDQEPDAPRKGSSDAGMSCRQAACPLRYMMYYERAQGLLKDVWGNGNLDIPAGV